MNYLPLVLLIGLTAFMLTAVIRSVVPQSWLLFKPWACDLCMSWWTAWLSVILINLVEPISQSHGLQSALAGGGVALFLTKALNRLGV